MVELDDDHENGTDGGDSDEGEFEEYSRDRSMDVSQRAFYAAPKNLL
jgi:hypothetical protein